MSAGLIFNWLAALAVLGTTLWMGYNAVRTYRRHDWAVFAQVVAIVAVVVWFAMFLGGYNDWYRRRSSGTPFGYGAMLATLWLPFFNLPLAIIVGLLLSQSLRWRRRRR